MAAGDGAPAFAAPAPVLALRAEGAFAARRQGFSVEVAASPRRRPRRAAAPHPPPPAAAANGSAASAVRADAPGPGSRGTSAAADGAPTPSPPPRANGLVVWGPPGSGKTSLCTALAHLHGLVHISPGDLLRAHVRYRTERGTHIKHFVDAGRAIPDHIVLPVVLDRLSMDDCVERGFVLDGFPRSALQYTALKDTGYEYRAAFMLHAPRTVLERRIENRRVDPETGLLYNLRYCPPEELEVLERLVALDKDVGRNISQLLAMYGRAAADMFDHIAVPTVRIDANRDIADVLADISDVLCDRGFVATPEPRDTGLAISPAAPSARAGRRRASAVLPEHLGARSVADDDDSRSVDADSAPSPRRHTGDAESAGGPILREPSGNGLPNSFNSAHDDANYVNGLHDDSPARSSSLENLVNAANDSEADASVTTVADSKSPITLIRCDGYMCERESVDGSNIAFRGAATEQVMLVWNRKPETVLLLVKKDPSLMPSVMEAALYLKEVQGMHVVAESQVQTAALANGMYLDSFTRPELLHRAIDFVVCLGGDGLILHVSTLFKTAVPPVLSFNLGSLGFLTPFDYASFESVIEELLEGSCLLSLRMRLTCTILRAGVPSKEFEVLNEVVIDRGSSPYLSNLDCFCDDKYITTVQADGIIMSTPTGSTAYSMSAGGSMVHPSVPAILFTPICPHSLSFRPIVFPDAAKLRIDIAEDARSHAWASFDGKFRQQLRRGDGLIVQMSLYPVPTINKTDHTGDWFQSLDRAFNFNSRAMQKGFTTALAASGKKKIRQLEGPIDRESEGDEPQPSSESSVESDPSRKRSMGSAESGMMSTLSSSSDDWMPYSTARLENEEETHYSEFKTAGPPTP